MNLKNASAQEIINAILQKEVSAVEVVTSHITAIENSNPALNAVVQSNWELSLQQAKFADQHLARGKSLGKLHGLPITIKDTCLVKDYICTMGTLGYAHYKAEQDATCVARLKAEGAIILGLTNMAELGAAFETDNLVYGRTNNPYDITCTPGGSSGGEAAMIAAGGSPLGLGADGGGSIRVPAHFCGIVGIKPTQGRIPLTGLLSPRDGIGTVNQIGTFGPMARYVDDLMLMLPIISGCDNVDSHVVPIPLANPNDVVVNSLRLAFFTDNGIAPATIETKNTVVEAAQQLAQLGCQVEELQLSALQDTYQLLWQLYFEGGDGAAGLIEFLQDIGSLKISPVLQQFIDRSSKTHWTTKEMLSLFAKVDIYRTKCLQLFKKYDVILSPVCATPAKKHGTTFDQIKDFTYTMMFNLTGWPSTVVRCGTSLDGLPIGVQITAKPWRDDVSLAVAKQLEIALGGYQQSNFKTKQVCKDTSI